MFILQQHDCLMVDEINDVRIIGVVTAVACLAITIIGMQWEARVSVTMAQPSINDIFTTRLNALNKCSV